MPLYPSKDSIKFSQENQLMDLEKVDENKLYSQLCDSSQSPFPHVITCHLLRKNPHLRYLACHLRTFKHDYSQTGRKLLWSMLKVKIMIAIHITDWLDKYPGDRGTSHFQYLLLSAFKHCNSFPGYIFHLEKPLNFGENDYRFRKSDDNRDT